MYIHKLYLNYAGFRIDGSSYLHSPYKITAHELQMLDSLGTEYAMYHIPARCEKDVHNFRSSTEAIIMVKVGW